MSEETNKVTNEENVPSATRVATPAAPAAQSTLVKDLAIPVSIVIAGAFVGLGFFFSGQPTSQVAAPGNTVVTGQEQPADTTDKITPVTEDDHIKGNINAPIKIVEYSDFECPFCKQFHTTIQSVLDKYGEDKVAWVFRQFPLEQLHPVKAMAAAMASECVNELGGNDAFWSFTDGYYDKTLTNNRTDIETLIPQLVTAAGVNQAAFSTCFESGKYTDEINKDIQNAVDTGGRGTPWTVVVGPDGKTYPVNGALPQAAIEQLIDSILN